MSTNRIYIYIYILLEQIFIAIDITNITYYNIHILYITRRANFAYNNINILHELLSIFQFNKHIIEFEIKLPEFE